MIEWTKEKPTSKGMQFFRPVDPDTGIPGPHDLVCYVPGSEVFESYPEGEWSSKSYFDSDEPTATTNKEIAMRCNKETPSRPGWYWLRTIKADHTITRIVYISNDIYIPKFQ